MGLDGISINQLRTVQEFNSSELNNVNNLNSLQNVKVVDGLSEGQKVDPDKENGSDDYQGSFDGEKSDNDAQENDDSADVIKYDLSQTDKYVLKINDDTNDILIMEKETNTIVDKINAKELSKLVHYLANSQGAIVNRKF